MKFTSIVSLLLFPLAAAFADSGNSVLRANDETYEIRVSGREAMNLENRLLKIVAPVSWKDGKKQLRIGVEDLVCVRADGESLAECSHDLNPPKSFIEALFGKPDPTPEELSAKGFRKAYFTIKKEYTTDLMNSLLRYGVEPAIESGSRVIRVQSIRCITRTEKGLTEIGDAWNQRSNAYCTLVVDPRSESKFQTLLSKWIQEVSSPAPN